MNARRRDSATRLHRWWRPPGSWMLVWLGLAGVALPLHADSARDLVDQGNAAFARQEYEQALSCYEEASVSAPESPYVSFDKGVVFYRQGEYAKARAAFEQAALKSTDIHLEAESRFNMGNTAFREAQRQQDSDLSKSLDACRESVGYYQEALRLDPQLTKAAENIEVVRLVMKSLLDKIKEQQKKAAQQQQAQQQAADKLKELIDRQEAAAVRSQALADDTGPGAADSSASLAAAQRQLQDETEQLAAGLADTSQGTSPPPDVGRHVQQAVEKQDTAAAALEQGDAQRAAPEQEDAAQELKQALAALEQGQQNQQDQQGKQDQQDGGQQGKQQAQDSQQQDSADQDGKSATGESAAADSSQDAPQQQLQKQSGALSEEARDILDEERENAQRRSAQAAGYRAVDKDW